MAIAAPRKSKSRKHTPRTVAVVKPTSWGTAGHTAYFDNDRAIELGIAILQATRSGDRVAIDVRGLVVYAMEPGDSNPE